MLLVLLLLLMQLLLYPSNTHPYAEHSPSSSSHSAVAHHPVLLGPAPASSLQCSPHGHSRLDEQGERLSER